MSIKAAPPEASPIAEALPDLGSGSRIDDGTRIGPSALERRVLRLMATGVTDEVAARRLCVTDRHYRRHVAAVMRRLGAQSRFQAGVVAAERGWL